MKPNMKLNKHILIILISLTALTGCQWIERQYQQPGAVVELNGRYIYRSTIDSLSLGLTSEDSALVVDAYINRWAKDILDEEHVKEWKQNHDNQSQEIEQMVADYRKSLYTHSYEQWLIERRMPKTVSDSAVEAVYNNLQDRFRLSESIAKGLLLIVANDAPNLKKLRKWLTDNEIDNIEKYAYQYAKGYELFADRWMTTTELLSQIPVERDKMETLLKQKNQIELSDSTKTYLLQITEKCMRGERMPVEYARPEIEELILSSRQVAFLQEERERMYRKALEDGTIKFY